MRILLLEPFYTGSHRAWAEQLAYHSKHEILILSMTGRYWKWRMHGAAVTLSNRVKSFDRPIDLILATDMLDVSTFLALIKDHLPKTPLFLYFHENQMAYPWGQNITRNNNWRHYAFINYASALSADKVLFNSQYNRDSFHQEAYQLLNSYQDYNELETVDTIREKSEVLPLGLNLASFDPVINNTGRSKDPPLIVWNHRWEGDKNPEAFAKLIMTLNEEGYNFELALLGEAPYGNIKVFEELKAELGDKVVAFGYAESFEEYAAWLAQADLLPVTSNQDFFGGSVVEAIYCGCYPILPNRLAYPEHLPIEYNAVLYDTFQELLWKTKWAIANIKEIRNYDLSYQVKKYDWRYMIPQYDQVFETCFPVSN